MALKLNRPLKSKDQLILEGFSAEGALVFLDDFFEDEKSKLLQQMLICPEDDLSSRRAVYKYLCSLQKTMENKVVIGIQYATEQPE